MVHSGGFYQVEKRRPGPGEVPPVLHWFKWEAMLTWITGIFVARAGLLFDDAYRSIPARSHWPWTRSPWNRAAHFWVLIYDWLWRWDDRYASLNSRPHEHEMPVIHVSSLPLEPCRTGGTSPGRDGVSPPDRIRRCGPSRDRLRRPAVA